MANENAQSTIDTQYPTPDEIAKIILNADQNGLEYERLLKKSKEKTKNLSPAAQIFKDYVNIMTSLMRYESYKSNGPNQKEQFFLANIDTIFKDPEIRFQVRRTIAKYNRYLHSLYRHNLLMENVKSGKLDALIDLINFEYDYYEAPNREVDLQISRDAFELVKREFIKEQSNTPPDISKALDIMGILNSIEQFVETHLDKELSQKMKQSINELKNNDAEYVAKFPAMQEERILNAEQALAAEKQARANEQKEHEQIVRRLNEEMERLKEQLEREREQKKDHIQTLQGMMRKESAKANATKSKLDELIAGSKKMQSGLGSRGVNKYKELVAKIERDNEK